MPFLNYYIIKYNSSSRRLENAVYVSFFFPLFSYFPRLPLFPRTFARCLFGRCPPHARAPVVSLLVIIAKISRSAAAAHGSRSDARREIRYTSHRPAVITVHTPCRHNDVSHNVNITASSLKRGSYDDDKIIIITQPRIVCSCAYELEK